MSLDLDTCFDATPGAATKVAPDVLRVTAPNSGPLTFKGTNTYIVGRESLVVIDPGPREPDHLTALLRAIDGRPVEAILVTHTHLDHTGLTDDLRSATGAPVLAEGRHRMSRPLRLGETNPLDAAADHGFSPDRIVQDGEMIVARAGSLQAVSTPGHTANHMSYALDAEGILFSGDHVMAWSTSIVAPPAGRMADFMQSLDKLLTRNDRRYLPGHGGPVEQPGRFVRALRAHRKMREQAILERLRAGDRTIADLVASIYRTTPVALHRAAGLSVLAHLEDLVERNIVTTTDGIVLHGRFIPV